ncbi:MAG: CBASS cGAMP-activated phospholipase [Flavobacteriales bacterium]
MPDKKFTVLSIDGGGIRGILAAEFLAEMEARLQQDGKSPRLREHFDLICGTSTGSIIALALALDIPAQTIVDLYRNNARAIFCKRSFGWIWSKYRSRALEALVRKTFQGEDKTDPRLIDLKTRVCIPAYDLLAATTRVFKTPHHPQFHIDLHIPAYMVAMASSAAPTYFNPYSSSYANLQSGAETPFDLKVDGGIFANNPSLIGLTEAHRGLGHKLEEIRLLSIGTGHSTFSEGRRRIVWGLFPKPWGRFYWMRKARVLDLMMQAQAQSIHFNIDILSGGVGAVKNYIFPYERISVDLGSNLKLPLDTKGKRKIRTLVQLGHRAFQTYGAKVIATFIDDNNFRDYTPPVRPTTKPTP